MSKGLKIFSAIVGLTCLLACGRLEDDAPQQPAELESAGSLEAEFVSATASTASFEYDLSIHPDAGKSFRAGILYSTSQRFTTSSAMRAVIENPVDGAGVLTLEGLSFATKYYYATYVYRLGKYEISEVKDFTTELVQVDMEATDVRFNEATIVGRMHIEEGLKDKLKLGFKFSDVEDFSSEKTLDSALDFEEDGSFSVRVTGLDQGTPYFYTCYVSQGSTKVTLPVQKFISSSPYIESFGNLDIAAAKDLSAEGSANSYILTGPGVYKFKAVKGNSDEPVGDVAIVHVLWETFGTTSIPDACELIDATAYKDGYAAVRVPEDFKEGNALVVAKNADGQIIWSWHFWLTAQAPGEHVYANGAGVMMDRNLGALSMKKGDPKGFGLLYQWGRKDPFPGSATLNGTSMVSTTAKMYATLSSATDGTIEYAVQHPSTIILAQGGKSTDWLHYDAGTNRYDNTRWQVEKTMYDPCPPGWKVPQGGSEGIWYAAGIPTGGGFPYHAEDYALAGITIPSQYCGEDAWYPAAGSINATDGTFVDVGWDGVYWSVSPCGLTDVYGFNFYYYRENTGYVYHSAMLSRATAASVRCCKD